MTLTDEVRAFNRFYTREIGLLNRSLPATELSLPEARVLYEVAQALEGGRTAAEIGRTLGMDKAHLSRIVARFVTRGLREAGHTVAHADNGRDGLFSAASESYDVIVMDRMLPGNIDGLGIIEALRKAGNRTPILILSALSDVDERIKGLKSGGDDYLTKPFAFGELLARVDALGRRAGDPGADRVLQVGDLRMDLLSRRVTRGSRPVTLQPREFKLLEYLMRHAEQVVTRTMLLEAVWDYNFDPQTNVVDVHISKLRQKIELDSERPLVRTVRNAGYMMSADG